MDDAILAKHNTITIYLVNHLGGHAPTLPLPPRAFE